jgi:hypothetical protein
MVWMVPKDGKLVVCWVVEEVGCSALFLVEKFAS